MKELSIEEKAKAYDEAIEYAHHLINECCKDGTDGSFHRADLQKMFPELKESEDEKIRKALLEMVHDTTGDSLWVDYNVHKEDAIAWLEKRGEQKPFLPKWKYKNDNIPLLRDSIILNKYGYVAKLPSGALVDDVWVLDYNELAKLPKEELEKRGNSMGISEATKQKLEDSLKKALEKEIPESLDKFLDEQGEQKQDVNIQINPSEYINDMGGNGCYLKNTAQKPADKVEPKFKVGQTIKKEGFNTSFTIVKVNDGFYYNNMGDHFPFTDQDNWELVEQKPAETEKGANGNEREIPNSAWSEEDEEIIETMCKQGDLKPSERVWLKSLKDRYTWKPSDEQMDALEYAIRYGEEESIGILSLLYNDLKKLKG